MQTSGVESVGLRDGGEWDNFPGECTKEIEGRSEGKGGYGGGRGLGVWRGKADCGSVC